MDATKVVESVEEWRDVPGYVAYQASSFGRIRSIDRMVKGPYQARVNICKKGKIIKLHLQKTGYIRTSLGVNGKAKCFFVHRLIALAFHSNSENKSQVNHINGNKADNRPENLEWVTGAENIAHSVGSGLRSYDKQPTRTPKQPQIRHRSVYCFNDFGEMVKEYSSVKVATDGNNLTRNAIYSALHRQAKSAGVWWSYNSTPPCHLKKEHLRRRVLCKKTNKVFDSARQAAKICGISASYVGRLIAGQMVDKKYDFAWINE